MKFPIIEWGCREFTLFLHLLINQSYQIEINIVDFILIFFIISLLGLKLDT